MATETRTLIWQIIGKTVGMGRLNAETNKAAASMAKLALRAAAVIPLWVAMRAAIFALPRAIAASTREWLTFQSEMSRVATVTRTTAQGMKILEDAIVDSASRSKVSFKDTASVVYALGSAGLTAKQQLEGFNHVIDLATGTGGNLEQTAKLVAGAVNVFGKSLKDAATAGEKFKKVSDVIAYTYSTQQVELAELATAMGYVASVGTLVDIQFEELVATIGVLNTGMLKGSKSGTSLVNAFIQLARKSDRLSELGIEVDTSKPLNFLEVMKQLKAAVDDDSLSLDQLSAVMRTFGIRGGRAVGLLLNNWEAFQKTLIKTKKDSKDFAEIMKRMAEDNIPAQARKIRDSFTGIWKGVLDTVEDPWMDFLKRVFDALERFRAHEAFKKLSGERTLGERLQKSVPAAGIGTAALFAGRAITPSIGLNPKLELAAERLAESAKYRVGSRGGIHERGILGSRALTAAEQAVRGGAKPTTAMFRPDAIRNTGYVNSAMMNLGGTLKNTAKGAILAYGALKLVQSIVNQIGDEDTADQVNKAVGGLEAAVAWISRQFVKLGDFIYHLFKGLIDTLVLGANRLETFVNDFGKIFKALFDPIITVIQLLRREISGIEALNRIKGFGDNIVDAQQNFNRNRGQEIKDDMQKQKDKSIWEWAFGWIGAGAVEDAKEARKARVEKLANAKSASLFQQNIADFTRRMGIQGQGDPNAELNRVRAELAQERLNASKATFGITDADLRIQGLFKEFSKGAMTEEQYTSGVLKEQAKIEKIINANANKLGGINSDYVFNIKKALGVTGKAALVEGGDTAAFRKAQKEIYLGGVGAPPLTEEEEKTGAILKQFDADIQQVISNAAAEKLKLFGISDEVIAMEKFKAEYQNFIDLKGGAIKLSGEELEISDFMVENSDKLRRIVEHNSSLQKEIVKLQKEGLKLTQDQAKAMKETASYVKSAFKDTFKDIFETSDFDFSNAADKFGIALKSAWQDQFSDIFADVATNITGLDTAFGGIMNAFGNELKQATSPIAQAHIDGIGKGVQMIINAHETGIINGMLGKTSKSSAGSIGGGIGGMIGGFLKQATGPTSAIGKFLGTAAFSGTYAPQGSSSTGVGSKQISSGAMGRAAAAQQEIIDFNKAGAVKGSGASPDQFQATTYGDIAGAAFNSAVTGFSTYQAAGGSEGGWMAGLAGAMTGIGSLGLGAAGMTTAAGTALLGSMAGPVGWIGLGLAAGGMLLGAFNQPEKPAFRNEEVREQTTQIASRIDITNNSLEWVNRNLVELKQELTYIMRESFYFSEKSETERFSIDAQRGTLG